MIKTLALIATILILSFTTDKPKQQEKEQMVTVTLPAKWYPAVVSGLQELPAKIANPIVDSIISQYNKQMIKPK